MYRSGPQVIILGVPRSTYLLTGIEVFQYFKTDMAIQCILADYQQKGCGPIFTWTCNVSKYIPLPMAVVSWIILSSKSMTPLWSKLFLILNPNVKPFPTVILIYSYSVQPPRRWSATHFLSVKCAFFFKEINIKIPLQWSFEPKQNKRKQNETKNQTLTSIVFPVHAIKGVSGRGSREEQIYERRDWVAVLAVTCLSK